MGEESGGARGDALVDFLVVPAHRDATRDDCAHGGSANEVDRDIGFTEGAHDSDMGIGPRTAA